MSGGDHPPALSHVQGHGFLAHHVLAGLQHLDGDRRVKVVWQADDDGVDVRVGRHTLQVRVDLGNAVPLGQGVGRVAVQVADSDHLRPRIVLQGQHVVIADDDSGSDDADSCLGHVSPFDEWHLPNQRTPFSHQTG